MDTRIFPGVCYFAISAPVVWLSSDIISSDIMSTAINIMT